MDQSYLELLLEKRLMRNSTDIATTTEKLILNLSLGKDLSIHEVFPDVFTSTQVETELKEIYVEAYKTFGVKPFSFYIGTDGELHIRAESCVGILSGKFFDVALFPKIEKFDIAKALTMAQYCSSGALKVSSGKIRSQLNENTVHTPLDLLAFSLSNAVEEIVKNGLAKKFDEVLVVTNRKSGTLNFQDWMSRALVPPPSKTDIESSPDIFPNRLILSALYYCSQNTKNSKLSGVLQNLISSFDGVNGEVDDIDIESFKIHHFNTPRHDYEYALGLSTAILKGKSVDFNGDTHTLPNAVVDFDLVFEEFCSLKIREMLNPKIFEVLLQPEFRHPTTPEIRGHFSPDIVVANKKTKKKIVLDVKNKYKLTSMNEQVLSNADLYQLTYYSNCLGSNKCILLYPSISPKHEFPLRASESDSSYEAKINKFLRSEIGSGVSVANPNGEPVQLFKYQIDLSGSLQNTIKSIAGACLFLENLGAK